ncbi:MAG TPA: Gfo/Idh/MocA family oxidoreductase [Terriglobia bacterium]|nr:Gfo/Idh/MocA family oxidoreductase [Terriglobia bacterium]
MSTRREFIGQVVGGAAAAAAGGMYPSARVLGANDRVRFGLIGCGGRGQEDFKAALKCTNVEPVAVADVYTRRLDEAKSIAPQVKTCRDFRELLDDKSLDAVLIATPQHQHALNFVPALQAGKDVYQEKTMAFNPDHARRMRRAFEGSGRVVQVGIQSTSSATFEQTKSLISPDRTGVVTAIHTHMYRNAPYGGWRRPLPADCDPQHVDWAMFQGEAAPHDFDPNRVINWRFYWDYSGGNVFENMVHQVGFWYKVLGLNVPRSVTMAGANYLSPDMQVPDTMSVAMDQPENLLFSWSSGFGNRYYGSTDDLLLGNKGTLLRGDDRVRYVAQDLHGHRHAPDAETAPQGAQGGATPDIVGKSDTTVEHMQNFFDCVRSRKEPNCPFEIGYRSAIACQMANRSYREKRTVCWDAEREEIV